MHICQFALNGQTAYMRTVPAEPPYGRLRRNGQGIGAMRTDARNGQASALIPKTAIFTNFFAFGQTHF